MNKRIKILIVIAFFLALFLWTIFSLEKGGKERPTASTYYAMDNVHEVAVHPGRKELYVTSIHSPLILVVNIDSADYPVLSEIKLPGGDLDFTPYIIFSHNGAHAYMTRHHYNEYIASWGLQNASYIVVINCAKRKIDRIISPPYELWASLVPSPDGRWLYFATQPRPGRPAGIGKLDLSNLEVVGFLPLSSNSNPFITLSSNGKYIYAAQGEHPSGFGDNLFKVVDAESLKVISSVEVGDGPRYVAVTPDGSKAYVSNQWSNSVSVINLDTMKVAENIPVGPEPRKIAVTPDGSKAYVALPGVAQMLAGGPGYLAGNSVAVIDTKQNILLGSVDVHPDPESVAMDPDGTRVYVGDGGCNGPVDPAEVHVIETTKDTYFRSIILRQAAQYAPAGIDVTPDNSKIFVTIFTGFPKGSLIVIDVATGNVVDKLNINPRAVKVSADGSKVYAFSPASDSSEAKLFIIDSNSLKILKSINLGKTGCLDVGPIPSYRIIINSAETVAYINYETLQKNVKGPEWVDPDDTGLVAVDFAKENVDKIFYSKNPDVNHKGMALTPDETRLFVSDPSSQTVVAINTSTNEIVARIPVGNSPSEIKISKDGKRAYVLQQFGTLITIIDVNTYELLKRIDFPSGIHAQMDFEFSLDERYVYTAGFDSNFVLVYDLQQGRVIKAIDTGLDPLVMARTPNSHYIYVSEVTDDEISVVDTTTNNIVKTIKLL